MATAPGAAGRGSVPGAVSAATGSALGCLLLSSHALQI